MIQNLYANACPVINYVPFAAASDDDKREVVREVIRAINVWIYEACEDEGAPIDD